MCRLSLCFLLLPLVVACAAHRPAPVASSRSGLAEEIILGQADLGHRLVPLVALLVDPQRLGGRSVRVEGVLNLSFDGPVLCLDRESARDLVYSKCLWLDFEPEDLKALGLSSAKLPQWTGRYALLDGTVSAMQGAELDWNTVGLSKVSSMIVRGDTVRSCPARDDDRR